MVVLDTCAIIYDALSPDKLSSNAKRVISENERKNQLICSDISLWEIAMLIHKKRLNVDTDALSFMKLAMTARNISVKIITPEVAHLSSTLPEKVKADPADRIILSLAITNKALLVTCDENLTRSGLVKTIW